MVKYLIVTHGPLAEAFKESAGMFFGDAVDEIETIGLFPDDSVDGLKDRIVDTIRTNYSEDGMMILVDMMGGSPYNMVAMAMGECLEACPKLECFTGLNLPILMELLSMGTEATLEELCYRIEEVASSTIVNVRKALGISENRDNS